MKNSTARLIDWTERNCLVAWIRATNPFAQTKPCCQVVVRYNGAMRFSLILSRGRSVSLFQLSTHCQQHDFVSQLSNFQCWFLMTVTFTYSAKVLV